MVDIRLGLHRIGHDQRHCWNRQGLEKRCCRPPAFRNIRHRCFRSCGRHHRSGHDNAVTGVFSGTQIRNTSMFCFERKNRQILPPKTATPFNLLRHLRDRQVKVLYLVPVYNSTLCKASRQPALSTTTTHASIANTHTANIIIGLHTGLGPRQRRCLI